MVKTRILKILRGSEKEKFAKNAKNHIIEKRQFWLRNMYHSSMALKSTRTVLKPVQKQSKLISKGGILVFIPDADFSKKSDDVVKKSRDERDRKVRR